MIILEFHEVEIDYCPACQGIWLDAGELELLFEDRDILAGFLTAGDAAAVAAGEKKRPCPICDKKMEKQATGGDAPVVYDKCPAGHGLWFDNGELAAVLEKGSEAPGGEEVVSWLCGMFSEDE
jgi:Zn-finger nucleic acid-binding protein